MQNAYFKILREDLTSLGFLGAARLQYKLNAWTQPMEPISGHPRKGGGLWVVDKLSAARGMQRYAQQKYRMKTKIFICRIGNIIPAKDRKPNSRRVKTDAVMLIREIK